MNALVGNARKLDVSQKATCRPSGLLSYVLNTAPPQLNINITTQDLDEERRDLALKTSMHILDHDEQDGDELDAEHEDII